MSDATIHIAAWEQAGLIDGETADRLRAAATAGGTADEPGSSPRSAVAELFGPSVTIPEVFGYLGGAFLLGAWSLFTGRASADGSIPTGGLLLVAAAALVAIGVVLRGRGERASRAAGVAFVAGTVYAAAAVLSLLGTSSNASLTVVGAAAAGFALALVVRRFHPSVVTHGGALAWTVALGAALLRLVEDRLLMTGNGEPVAGGPGPVVLALAAAAFWLVVAVGIALVGLAEARWAAESGSRPAARRAALSRFWAGMTAVLGLYSALTPSGTLPNGDYGRVIEPIVADVALVVLAAVLVERAFRREATSFMYAAALGLILALTDFNVSYLSDTTEVALLVEGLILLGVGFVANRLRRQIGAGDGPATLDAGDRDAPASDASASDASPVDPVPATAGP